MEKFVYSLEFCGAGRSISFGIYPRINDKITLTQDKKVYRLKDTDIVNNNALAYYRSLAPAVKLRKVKVEAEEISDSDPAVPSVPAGDAEDSVSSVKEAEPAEAQKIAEEVPAAQETVKIEKEFELGNVSDKELSSMEIVEEVRTEHIEPSSDEVSETLVVGKDYDDLKEEIEESPMSESDICEYLDIHYSDDDLQKLAKDLGVNLGKVKRRDSIISKIVKKDFKKVMEFIKK